MPAQWAPLSCTLTASLRPVAHHEATGGAAQSGGSCKRTAFLVIISSRMGPTWCRVGAGVRFGGEGKGGEFHLAPTCIGLSSRRHLEWHRAERSGSFGGEGKGGELHLAPTCTGLRM
eukprot:1461166-Prymnesium_polylepis.3